MTRPSRWRDTASHGRALVRALLLATVLGGILAGTASAGTDSFCGGCTVGSNQQYLGPAHSLTGVRGTNHSTGLGCGGAYNYYSYFCGDPSGCHTYGGSTVLYPGIRHPYSGGKSMSGYSTWGSTGPPAGCSYSSVYAVSGPVADAARAPQGVPVFDRPAAQAPDDLAALVPNADLREARRFATPHGDAWVLSDPGGRQVCLAVDDHGSGYGYTCQRLGVVQSSGLLATLEDGDATSADGDVVIAVAPEGVDALIVRRADGSTRRVAVEGGVAVAQLTARDELVTLPAADDAPAGVKAKRYRLAR